MHRRRDLAMLAASTFAAAAAASTAKAEDGGSLEDGGLGAALRRFRALPGTKSYLIHAGDGGSLGQIAYQPRVFLFTASAFKTFVLAQYLRDVEANLLSEDEQLAIDDKSRNIGSPVFIDLAGTTTARSVLEAMITHSDNMATDIAMGKVGTDRARALIAEAGLHDTRIPTSTRQFTSYIVGEPAGVDLGWPGILEALMKDPPGPFRPLLNDVETLASTAHDFVSWYEQALQGAFFTKPKTLAEFKRIQAMSVQIVETVPPDTPAYAKGGEVESFNGFNAKSFAGQMIVGGQRPVTFCFIVNWTGPASEFEAVQAEYFAAIMDILTIVKRALE